MSDEAVAERVAREYMGLDRPRLLAKRWGIELELDLPTFPESNWMLPVLRLVLARINAELARRIRQPRRAADRRADDALMHGDAGQ